MERDSFLYNVRRKLQVVAKHLVPNRLLSKIYYRKVTGDKLNLKNPRSFNEKLQWLKLYYFPNSSLVINCADKLKVRDYVSEKGFKHLLVPLLGSWEDPKLIDFARLPNQFVLKCNHGCAYNIIVEDKKERDLRKDVKQLKKWLKEDFGSFNIEPHYSKIKPRMVICERYLGSSLVDYKFFCFNGKPMFVYVSSDLIHDRQAKIGFFNLDGSKMDLRRDDYAEIEHVEFPLFFQEMLNAANCLSKDFPFVRVDFFVTDNSFYFAELTFTPSACMMPFNPKETNLVWGQMLDISNLKK